MTPNHACGATTIAQTYWDRCPKYLNAKLCKPTVVRRVINWLTRNQPHLLVLNDCRNQMVVVTTGLLQPGCRNLVVVTRWLSDQVVVTRLMQLDGPDGCRNHQQQGTNATDTKLSTLVSHNKFICNQKKKNTKKSNKKEKENTNKSACAWHSPGTTSHYYHCPCLTLLRFWLYADSVAV